MSIEPTVNTTRTCKIGNIACIVITQSGLRMALQLRAALAAQVDIYASARVVRGIEAERREAPDDDPVIAQIAYTVVDTVTDALARCWHGYDQLVLCLALGAAVRLIAPFLQDKRRDPGVVVIDDGGTFVVSVLSGHLGGANALAYEAARILKALPVITTASDVHATLTIDLLGKEQCWTLEPSSDLTGVAAAIVNGEPVAILQEAGSRDWWMQRPAWSSHLQYLTDRQALRSAHSIAAQVLITDRTVEDIPLHGCPTVLYRPATLVLGIGCRRGVAFADLERFVQTVLQEHGLSGKSVVTLATADIKGDEIAILELAQRYGWNLETHSVQALRAIKDTPSPSARVEQLIGTPSVSEASALLSSDHGELVVPKQKGVGMTVAVARKRCTRSERPCAVPKMHIVLAREKGDIEQ
jgi:cobalt-precorrin 5A hydrolase